MASTALCDRLTLVIALLIKMDPATWSSYYISDGLLRDAQIGFYTEKNGSRFGLSVRGVLAICVRSN